jgi:hypothetical protein
MGFWNAGYGGGYDYGSCGYGYGGGYGYSGGSFGSNSFTLLVVLFVLLIIVGSNYPIANQGGGQ